MAIPAPTLQTAQDTYKGIPSQNITKNAERHIRTGINYLFVWPLLNSMHAFSVPLFAASQFFF